MEQESTFGARLRSLMDESGLSYEQLGDRLNMNPQTLNRYVLGQREPKIGTAAAIARSLGVDPLWLQGFNVPRRPPCPAHREPVVPILGVIRAGTPILASQQIEGYAAADVPDPEEHFYLRVIGDSMINAGIRDGDLVLIRRQSTAENGQKVVALIDDSATVKTFYKEDGHIRLQPENDSMEPIIVEPDQPFQILGKVIGVFRFMR